jgi:hypothetical protein
MNAGRRLISRTALVLGIISLPHQSGAQIEPYNNKFNSGQNVAPIFEGWSRNQDGSFAMHFGYLNRNYVEEIHVPLGPNNNITPAGPDRGQPTYFYTRIHRYSFSVVVPKDWGKKELVWTLTANGQTEKAVGWLQPDWEIDDDVQRRNGGLKHADPETMAKNRPPSITLEPVTSVTLPNSLLLAPAVTDDGLPKSTQVRDFSRRNTVGQETPPILKGSPEAPVNLPQLVIDRRRLTPPPGLSIAWIVYRGPAKVEFEPAGFTTVMDGKAPVTATFTTPGEYVLRARATDTMLFTEQDVKITVVGSSPGNRP